MANIYYKEKSEGFGPSQEQISSFGEAGLLRYENTLNGHELESLRDAEGNCFLVGEGIQIGFEVRPMSDINSEDHPDNTLEIYSNFGVASEASVDEDILQLSVKLPFGDSHYGIITCYGELVKEPESLKEVLSGLQWNEINWVNYMHDNSHSAEAAEEYRLKLMERNYGDVPSLEFLKQTGRYMDAENAYSKIVSGTDMLNELIRKSDEALEGSTRLALVKKLLVIQEFFDRDLVDRSVDRSTVENAYNINGVLYLILKLSTFFEDKIRYPSKMDMQNLVTANKDIKSRIDDLPSNYKQAFSQMYFDLQALERNEDRLMLLLPLTAMIIAKQKFKSFKEAYDDIYNSFFYSLSQEKRKKWNDYLSAEGDRIEKVREEFNNKNALSKN